MGIRHIELDLYHFLILGGFRICHNPVPPPDFVFFVNNAARQQDQYPLDWTVTNIACDRNKPDLETLYREVRSWMDLPANRQEILVLYIDNKNVLPLFIEDFANITLTVFGDVLFTPEQKREEYPNAWPTPAELVSKNRRILFEMRKDWWIGDPLAERYIFMPGLWDVQFGIGNFQKFPSCLVNGNDYYGKEMTRSLDGSTAWGPAASYRGSPGDYPGEIINQMSRFLKIPYSQQVWSQHSGIRPSLR